MSEFDDVLRAADPLDGRRPDGLTASAVEAAHESIGAAPVVTPLRRRRPSWPLATAAAAACAAVVVASFLLPQGHSVPAVPAAAGSSPSGTPSWLSSPSGPPPSVSPEDLGPLITPRGAHTGVHQRATAGSWDTSELLDVCADDFPAAVKALRPAGLVLPPGLRWSQIDAYIVSLDRCLRPDPTVPFRAYTAGETANDVRLQYINAVERAWQVAWIHRMEGGDTAGARRALERFQSCQQQPLARRAEAWQRRYPGWRADPTPALMRAGNLKAVLVEVSDLGETWDRFVR